MVDSRSPGMPAGGGTISPLRMMNSCRLLRFIFCEALLCRSLCVCPLLLDGTRFTPNAKSAPRALGLATLDQALGRLAGFRTRSLKDQSAGWTARTESADAIALGCVNAWTNNCLSLEMIANTVLNRLDLGVRELEQSLRRRAAQKRVRFEGGRLHGKDRNMASMMRGASGPRWSSVNRQGGSRLHGPPGKQERRDAWRRRPSGPA